MEAKGALWVETPKGKSFLEEIDFGLEGEEERDLKGRNGFHLLSSPIFLLFFIFFGCFPPLHELISFSGVLDVV